MNNSNGWGGARPNAGRKTKAETLDLIGLIEDVVSEKDRLAIVKKLAEKAKSGSFPHLQMYFQYYYGKPAEKLHVTSDQHETPIDLDQLSDSAMEELVKLTEGVIPDENDPKD